MGFRDYAILRTLKGYFRPDQETPAVPGAGTAGVQSLLSGTSMEQLYLFDPASCGEVPSPAYLRVLRFFKVPMNPRYLLKNLEASEPDAARILEEALQGKWLRPVDGIPLTTVVDQKRWDFYGALGSSSHPSEVQLNITNRCVNRCRMCRKYEWDQIDMPIEKVGGLVEELKDMGTSLIILSGGEPFLHRDIDEILQMIAGVETLAFTSGCVPLTEKKVRGLSRIQFSVDALDPDIYRFIRGPGSVETVRTNILKARDAGCRVTVTTVMQRANIMHVPDIIDFCERENVPFLPSAVHSYDDMAFYDVGRRHLPPVCAVPFYHCLIDPRGDVFVCCHHHEDNTGYDKIDRSRILGNVFDGGFREIWSSTRAGEIKEQLYHERASFCSGCYRYLLDNDVASFVRSHEGNKELPFSHTYFFPLAMARMRPEE